MKLFLSTVTVRSTPLDIGRVTGDIDLTCTYVFMQAFGVLQGYHMSNDGHKLICTDTVPDHHHYDTLPYSLRNLRLDSVHEKVEEWANARYGDGGLGRRTITCDFREVTEAEHKWFMTKGLYVYPAQLLQDIAYRVRGSLVSRVSAVADSMRARAMTPPDTMRRADTLKAWHKGRRYSADGFRTARNFCKMMGQLIREAIHTNDASHCEDVFMDNYDYDDVLHHDIFRRMSEVMGRAGMSLHNEVMYCDHIDRAENAGQVRVNGRMRHYCNYCMEDDNIVVYAIDTDEHMLRDDAYYSEYRDEWLSCEPDSDDYEDSDSGDDDSNTERLMSYSTNVLDHLMFDTSITSAPFGNFLLGVEFELVTRGYMSTAVEDVRSQLGEEYCICKSDGSLPDGGLEIVTAPRGLDEHVERFSKWTINSDYSAWKTGRCGMHVHIDSRAFTSLTLGKFIMLINTEANAEFIRKIAGRHPLMDSQARSYCRTEMQSELTNPSKALKGKNTDRYTMVNIANLKRAEAKRLGVPSYDSGRYNTIELRIYRASLKKERLLAQLEFTHAAVMFCRVASMRDLNGVSFLKWLKTTDNRYPHLADWYGVRRRPTAKGAEPAEVRCEDVVPPAPATEIRHTLNYPLVVDQGDAALAFIAQEDLHAEYGEVGDTSVMYFPYSGSDDNMIDADDVVYTLNRATRQWHLQPAGTFTNSFATN
jgi:hypothetical protein